MNIGQFIIFWKNLLLPPVQNNSPKMGVSRLPPVQNNCITHFQEIILNQREY
jgi:hypothetical protein